MSDKTLTLRQTQILTCSQLGVQYALSDLSLLLARYSKAPAPSAPTLRRDMAMLCDRGFFQQAGSRKSTRYTLNAKRVIFAPIEATDYCQYDIDIRPGNQQFNFDLFSNVPNELFNESEVSLLYEATHKYSQSSIGASPTICRKELERFIIELSWKSSKIEGNTYTLLDTELLIREGIEATGRTREEAVMILNHKRAFDFILQFKQEFSQPQLSQVIDIHRLLVTELGIPYGLRNRLIGITGSIYRPLQVPTQIQEACETLIASLERQRDSFSKALLALAGISYIQPFEDGNKRTSRLVANAILLATQLAPLSYRSISELSYREAMLTFYEKNTILPFKKLFIEQYLFACDNYLQFAK